jgi:EAL domain-containing protein (putative c-di-GMP-specific phosphodiesterase class I)
LQEYLSINFLPNAVYQPAACIRSTFEAAQRYQFPIERIIFEVTEGERVDDRPHLVNIFREYSRFGFRTAIDDFGAGYAGLNLLSEYQPDIVKIDMDLIRDIDTSKPKQVIVHGISRDLCWFECARTGRRHRNQSGARLPARCRYRVNARIFILQTGISRNRRDRS